MVLDQPEGRGLHFGRNADFRAPISWGEAASPGGGSRKPTTGAPRKTNSAAAGKSARGAKATARAKMKMSPILHPGPRTSSGVNRRPAAEWASEGDKGPWKTESVDKSGAISIETAASQMGDRAKKMLETRMGRGPSNRIIRLRRQLYLSQLVGGGLVENYIPAGIGRRWHMSAPSARIWVMASAVESTEGRYVSYTHRSAAGHPIADHSFPKASIGAGGPQRRGGPDMAQQRETGGGPKERIIS